MFFHYVSKRIVANTSITLISQGVMLLTPLLTLPMLTRSLGIDSYGKMALASAMGGYATLIIDFGFTISAVRQLAITSSIESRSRIFWQIQFSKILLSIIAVFLLSCGIITLTKHEDIENAMMLAVALSALSCIAYPNWFFEGKQHFFTTSSFIIITKLIQIFIIFKFINSPKDFLLAIATESGFGILAGSLAFTKIYSSITSPKISDVTQIKKQLKEALPFFTTNISISLYTLVNPLILGLFASTTVVGNYAIADKVIQAAKRLLQPISTAIFPRIVETSSNNRTTYKRQIKVISMVFIICGSSIFLLLFGGAREIVLFISGKSLEEAEVLIKIMAIIPLLTCISNIAAIHILIPHKQEVTVLKITAVTATIGILLSVFLSAHYFSAGIALSTLVSEILIAMLTVYFAKKFILH